MKREARFSLSFSESSGSISPHRVSLSGVDIEFIEVNVFGGEIFIDALISESTGSISPRRIRLSGVDMA